MTSPQPDPAQVAAALRRISRGLDELADALSDTSQRSEEDRNLAVVTEWGRRGLTRDEAIRLFSRHGFAHQTVGGWAKGGWLEVREDDRRYLTDRSLQWLAEQEEQP